jgi:hypothetical protein
VGRSSYQDDRRLRDQRRFPYLQPLREVGRLIQLDQEHPPVTQLTWYQCLNVLCPNNRIPRQIREHKGSNEPLHPPATSCSCGSALERSKFSEDEPYAVGAAEIERVTKENP